MSILSSSSLDLCPEGQIFVSDGAYYFMITVAVATVFAINVALSFRYNPFNILRELKAKLKNKNYINRMHSDSSDFEVKKTMEMKRRILQTRGMKDDKTDKNPWETEYKQLKFVRRIGAGNFGEVYEGTWLGSAVAIKTVVRDMVKDENFLKGFLEEIQLMSELHHPNVVMFLGACLKLPNVCLILEFCVHGDLLDFLQNERVHQIHLNMRLILKMACDIARGINYLHQKKSIIQRDIKSRNVLVDENLNAKIADFGLSRTRQDEDVGLTACGTPAWTAPEVVRMEDYTEKVDVYSFAVVMWELFTQELPYDGEGGVQVAYAAAEQGLRPPIPEHTPTLYSELIEECWSDNPDDRPGFGEILERLFQMMKTESDPLSAPQFYFGVRGGEEKHVLKQEIADLLNENELEAGIFEEDMKVIKDEEEKAEVLPETLQRYRRMSFSSSSSLSTNYKSAPKRHSAFGSQNFGSQNEIASSITRFRKLNNIDTDTESKTMPTESKTMPNYGTELQNTRRRSSGGLYSTG